MEEIVGDLDAEEARAFARAFERLCADGAVESDSPALFGFLMRSADLADAADLARAIEEQRPERRLCRVRLSPNEGWM